MQLAQSGVPLQLCINAKQGFPIKRLKNKCLHTDRDSLEHRSFCENDSSVDGPDIQMKFPAAFASLEKLAP